MEELNLLNRPAEKFGIPGVSFLQSPQRLHGIQIAPPG
jgi:hypothetical protein